MNTELYAVASRQSPHQLAENAPKYISKGNIAFFSGKARPHPRLRRDTLPTSTPYHPPHFVGPDDASGHGLSFSGAAVSGSDIGAAYFSPEFFGPICTVWSRIPFYIFRS